MSQLQTSILCQDAEKIFGFVPNLFKEIVKSPAAAETYLHGTRTLKISGSLTGTELQAIYLAISSWYRCDYCIPAHWTMGRKAEVPESEILLIEDRQLPKDPRLAALCSAAWKLLDTNGKPTEADIKEIEKAGVSREAIYEIVAMIGMKVITMWINRIGNVELDQNFQPAELA